MFTTHTTKQEFYNWWKTQDHRKHTCGDMVLYALLKAHFALPEQPDYIRSLKTSFTPHKKSGYATIIRMLKNYSSKWVWDYHTFEKVLAPYDYRNSLKSLLCTIISALEKVSNKAFSND